MSHDESNDAVVNYLRERDSRRRQRRQVWIVVAVVAGIVGWASYNMKHSIDAEHHRSEQRVQDISCAMNRRLCD